MGFSGGRGWMQWPNFFEGKLYFDRNAGTYVPIAHLYGFIWLFIAGVPWAALGAVALSWCGSKTRIGALGWMVRILFGIGGFLIASYLFQTFPRIFLPLYDQINYRAPNIGYDLRRLIRDDRSAIQHLGLYLGFLSFEVVRRDWKNVALILIVGFVSGIGWAALQNWKWASHVWPGVLFNWWRCWETSAGITIGLAYGLAFFFCNRPLRSQEDGKPLPTFNIPPNGERVAMVLGLLFGLGVSVRCGIKGWANIYLGNEEYWAMVARWIVNPICFLILAVFVVRALARPFPRDFRGDSFPRYTAVFWGVLVIQNILAQMVTGPWSQWAETAFGIYYLLLFIITGLITYHVSSLRRPVPESEEDAQEDESRVPSAT
jgi:hypothetical protein